MDVVRKATGQTLQSRRWQQAVRHWVETRATLLDPADIEELRRQGLQNPAASVIPMPEGPRVIWKRLWVARE